jgi:hypothetical protein
MSERVLQPNVQWIYNKTQEKKFQKSRKNGFHTSYTPEQIANYKKESAVSGCIEPDNLIG